MPSGMFLINWRRRLFSAGKENVDNNGTAGARRMTQKKSFASDNTSISLTSGCMLAKGERETRHN